MAVIQPALHVAQVGETWTRVEVSFSDYAIDCGTSTPCSGFGHEHLAPVMKRGRLGRGAALMRLCNEDASSQRTWSDGIRSRCAPEIAGWVENGGGCQ